MATVFDSATIAPQARLASLQRWHGWHGWHSNGWQSIAVGRSDQTAERWHGRSGGTAGTVGTGTSRKNFSIHLCAYLDCESWCVGACVTRLKV